jgi:hypothetical protein
MQGHAAIFLRRAMPRIIRAGTRAPRAAASENGVVLSMLHLRYKIAVRHRGRRGPGATGQAS